jgi:hypothetical protein
MVTARKLFVSLVLMMLATGGSVFFRSNLAVYRRIYAHHSQIQNEYMQIVNECDRDHANGGSVSAARGKMKAEWCDNAELMARRPITDLTWEDFWKQYTFCGGDPCDVVVARYTTNWSSMIGVGLMIISSGIFIYVSDVCKSSLGKRLAEKRYRRRGGGTRNEQLYHSLNAVCHPGIQAIQFAPHGHQQWQQQQQQQQAGGLHIVPEEFQVGALEYPSGQHHITRVRQRPGVMGSMVDRCISDYVGISGSASGETDSVSGSE